MQMNAFAKLIHKREADLEKDKLGLSWAKLKLRDAIEKKII